MDVVVVVAAAGIAVAGAVSSSGQTFRYSESGERRDPSQELTWDPPDRCFG